MDVDEKPAVAQAELKIRIVFSDGSMIGPGKADLLELIAETGSISAARLRMGMSYKRAWTLVETLNAIFEAPLVVRTRGGATGGGASLTDLGTEILASYRSLQARAGEAAATDLNAIEARLAVMSREK